MLGHPNTLTFRYGYRYGEVVLPKISAWKDDVKVRLIEGFHPEVRRAVAATIGCHFIGAALPHPDPEDPATVLAGALKRFCFKPPRPIKKLFKELIGFVKTQILPKFTPLSPLADVSVETWLKNNKNYSDTRKKMLLRKNENIHNQFGPIDRKSVV